MSINIFNYSDFMEYVDESGELNLQLNSSIDENDETHIEDHETIHALLSGPLGAMASHSEIAGMIMSIPEEIRGTEQDGFTIPEDAEYAFMDPEDESMMFLSSLQEAEDWINQNNLSAVSMYIMMGEDVPEEIPYFEDLDSMLADPFYGGTVYLFRNGFWGPFERIAQLEYEVSFVRSNVNSFSDRLNLVQRRYPNLSNFSYIYDALENSRHFVYKYDYSDSYSQGGVNLPRDAVSVSVLSLPDSPNDMLFKLLLERDYEKTEHLFDEEGFDPTSLPDDADFFYYIPNNENYITLPLYIESKWGIINTENLPVYSYKKKPDPQITDLQQQINDLTARLEALE